MRSPAVPCACRRARSARAINRSTPSRPSGSIIAEQKLARGVVRARAELGERRAMRSVCRPASFMRQLLRPSA